MDDYQKGWIWGAVVTGLFTIIMRLIFSDYFGNYKQGQIDCIQGEVKYELKKQINGELKWEEKSND